MRSCGTLLHISSLPGAYGIGSLGLPARRFCDFLYESGQGFWQVLPIHPTGAGDSPYSPLSVFAGNPYFIDLDLLHEAGLLSIQELLPHRQELGGPVEYGCLHRKRLPLLRLAFSRWEKPEKFVDFVRENSFWLEEYALFMALCHRFGEGGWQRFPEAVRLREPQTLRRLREERSEEYDFQLFLQYVFFEQWFALKDYANERGIRIIGDAPIYVAQDSADIWANPQLFLLDEALLPRLVAGCPPDYFSPEGQLWGNPLYDWGALAKEDYRWWRERMAHSLRLFDSVRIDHFRGFDSFYAIPAGEDTARSGSWLPGPGRALFTALEGSLGKMDIIAEDLGIIFDSVHALLNATGYPGMRVLQFAFSPEMTSTHLPHNYEKNSIAYTGTHDNDTTAGWLVSINQEERDRAVNYLRLGLRDEGLVWGCVRAVFASVAQTAIIPMQDYLGLGTDARMNIPSTAFGNWRFRLQEAELSPSLAGKIRALARLYGRAAR